MWRSDDPDDLRWWQWAFWITACRYSDARHALMRDGGGMLIIVGLIIVFLVAVVFGL